MIDTRKTVINVWKQEYKPFTKSQENGATYWGLGDMLRGLICTHMVSLYYGYNHFIDFSLHPIGKVLKQRPHPHEEYVRKNIDSSMEEFLQCPLNSGYVIDLIESSSFQTVLMSTNSHPYIYDEYIPEETKQYISGIMTPTDEFQQDIDAVMDGIIQWTKGAPFNIIQYRLGDDALVVEKDKKSKTELDNIKRHLKQHILPNEYYIILTDSNDFRQYIYRNLNDIPNVFVFDHKISHIGYHEDDDALKNSMLEFFIITKSKKITSFSVYSWISGFVKAASVIYNIPIEAETEITF